MLRPFVIEFVASFGFMGAEQWYAVHYPGCCTLLTGKN